MHELLCVEVGSHPGPWAAAGFAVADGRCRVGGTTIEFVAGDGIGAICIDGVPPGELDGMAVAGPGDTALGGVAPRDTALGGVAPRDTALGDAAPGDAAPVARHANGIGAIDHLVVRSPDVDRTAAALAGVGLELRRERRFAVGDTTVRQAFFWLGRTILELVGDDVSHGDGPAVAWGLAFTATDLDRVVSVAGGFATPPKPAVQPGRRILSLQGLGVPAAVLSPHPGRGPSDGGREGVSPSVPPPCGEP